MEYEVPRVSVWTGEIPFSACWDELGNYDTDGPMEIAFNIIPRNVPLPAVINYLKHNGGLKGYATCTGNRIGTVSNEAKRVVALNISDRDVANLISSLQSNADGFFIYDLKRTEAFSNHQMWNDVTEQAKKINIFHWDCVKTSSTPRKSSMSTYETITTSDRSWVCLLTRACRAHWE